MEVKPGYKQTEVGVIPEDWDVEPLGVLSDFVTSGSRGWAQFYSESGALFIRSQNVRDGRLSFEDVQYVSPPTGAEGNRTKVKLNDLLITITGNSVGNVALVEHTFDEAYISQHVGLVRLKEPTRGAYICRYLSPNSPGNPQIAGSQSGQSKPGLNLQNLIDFRIALPHTANELHAIATALSDVDALLGGLDRLIAKKRDLKQAAMQILLTGQNRLPGFYGEWAVKRLCTLLRFQVGFPFSSAFFNEKREGIRLVKNRDLKTDDQVFHYSGKYEEAFAVRDGDVLVGMDGDFLPCRWNKGRALLNQRVGRILPSGGLNLAFAFYALIEPLKEIEIVTSSTTVKHLSHGDIEGIERRMPELSEQTAIAEVLTDMDAELAALEQRREKTRALKQAMMQELLTGRTRLVARGGETMKNEPRSNSDLILYQTEDGRTRIQCRFENETVWLTQKLMAELFGKDVRTINEHIQNVFDEGELVADSVIRKFRITAADGKTYETQHYNLDVTISVGYRVKSPRGTQFRIWATQRLREYLVKGFTMDDERLKNPPGKGHVDYFDELLERIRDIRASERRVYLRVREILALAADYEATEPETQVFFQTIQNKLHFAATGKTAAELIAERADAAQPNMGLTAWRSGVVRKGDVTVAKNYLREAEIEELNRLVVMFLDFAEDQAKRRKQIFLQNWQTRLDDFLKLNERSILPNAGKVSREKAHTLADQEYERFAERRRALLEAEAEADPLHLLETEVKKLPKPKQPRPPKS